MRESLERLAPGALRSVGADPGPAPAEMERRFVTSPAVPRRGLPAGVGFAVGSALLFGLSTPCAKMLVGGDTAAAPRGAALRGVGTGSLRGPAGHASRPPGPTHEAGYAVARRCGHRRRHPGSGSPHVGASHHTGLVRVPAPQPRGRVHGAPRLVRLPRELRPPHRAGLGVLIVAGGVVLSWDFGPVGAGAAARRDRDRRGLPRVGRSTTTSRRGSPAPTRWASRRSRGGSPAVVNLDARRSRPARGRLRHHLRRGAAVGFLGYGVSLALFVVALRHLGTARTGAYFSLAPFFGAVASLPARASPLHRRWSWRALLMAWASGST